MTDWARVATLSCCVRFLASDAQKEMLSRIGVTYDEFLTKDDVSRILERQPATERQLALINYLGLSALSPLTKDQASEVIEAAKRDPTLGTRFDSWNIDRFELHPNLYAAERGLFKQGRAEILLDQYREFQSDMRGNGVKLRSLTLQEINGLIPRLDVTQPQWDRDIQLNGLDDLLALLGDSI